jgi:hypothetical protein
MLDDFFQADTDAAVNDLIRRPLPQAPQTPKFNAFRTIKAVPGGLAAAGLETMAMVPDVAGAIGSAFTASTANLLPEPKAPGGAEFRAREKQRAQDQAASSIEGDALRQASKPFMPDPTTAHAAEQTVFGLIKFGAKAVGSVATAGPVGGALAVGLNEGLTTADDLKAQGVDLGTRTAVGGVAGVASAAGVLLPVAGKTIPQTIGLVGVGGPGMFMAQQAATREILQAADYSKLSDQYDPFDPVGLAVSTLVPAGFGAWALRGMKLKAKAGEPVRNPEQLPADAPAVVNDQMTTRPTADHVDAARVEMLTQHIEAAGLHSPADARAAAMHLDAFARAMDDLSAGRRVDVTDLVPVDRMETAKALDTFAKGLETAQTDLMAQAAMRAEPGVVRQMQAELADAHAKAAEFEDPAAIKQRATELQQSGRVSFKQAMTQARKEFSALAEDMHARVARLENLLQDNATGQQAFDALNLMQRQADQVSQQRAAIDAPATQQTPTAAAAREALATTESTNGKQATQSAPADAAAPRAGEPQPAGARQAEPQTQPQTAAAPSPGPASAGEQRAGVSRTGSDAAEAAVVSQRLADIQTQFPDLTVQMDGMDKPMPLSEFLAEVQREAMEGSDFDIGGNDAPLMQVAATCFLLNG